MYQFSRTPTTAAGPNDETQQLWASWACKAFLGVSVTISVMGAWEKGPVPGVLFTIVMIAVVVLLSQTLGKALAYFEARNWRLFTQTVVMGFVFGLVEANLNHIGLEAMNMTYAIAPAEFLVPACIGLSLVNIFATDTYQSVPTIKLVRPKQVDLLIRSSRIPAEPTERHAARMDQWESQIGEPGSHRPTAQGISDTMAEVAKRMRQPSN